MLKILIYVKLLHSKVGKRLDQKVGILCVFVCVDNKTVFLFASPVDLKKMINNNTVLLFFF